MTAAVQRTACPKGTVDEVEAQLEVAVQVEHLELDAGQQRAAQLGAGELALNADVESAQGVEDQLAADDKTA